VRKHRKTIQVIVTVKINPATVLAALAVILKILT